MSFFSALTTNQKRKLRQAFIITVVSTCLGPLYALFSDGFTSIDPYVNAVIGGFLGGLVIAILEVYVFNHRTHKHKFLHVLLVRTFFYIVFIPVLLFHVFLFYRMRAYDLSYSEVLKNQEFQEYIFQRDFPILVLYAIAFAFIINFTLLMSRKIGRDVLLSFITGTYYKPKIIERIFMFMHVQHSREIAQKLGIRRFYEFVNDVLYDITDTILTHRGVIYQYVEDEVVISWAMHKGIEQANCIRTFFNIQQALKERKEKYVEKFGVFPLVQAAIHSGKVVRAEIGDVKSEIVFHGDVMNTTSRILHQCGALEESLLVSKAMLDQINLPEIYSSHDCGEITLKGKGHTMCLYGIKEHKLVTL